MILRTLACDCCGLPFDSDNMVDINIKGAMAFGEKAVYCTLEEGDYHYHKQCFIEMIQKSGPMEDNDE